MPSVMRAELGRRTNGPFRWLENERSHCTTSCRRRRDGRRSPPILGPTRTICPWDLRPARAATWPNTCSAEPYSGHGSRFRGRCVGGCGRDPGRGPRRVRPGPWVTDRRPPPIRGRLPGRALHLPGHRRDWGGQEVALDVLADIGGLPGRRDPAARVCTRAGRNYPPAGPRLVRGSSGCDRRGPIRDRDRDADGLSPQRPLGELLTLHVTALTWRRPSDTPHGVCRPARRWPNGSRRLWRPRISWLQDQKEV